MSDLEIYIQRLIGWARTHYDFPENWSDIQIVEDPFFTYRGETWKIPEDAFMNVNEYEGRFSDILMSGYSWVNLNFGGIYNNMAIVFIEFPHQSSGCSKAQVSVNLSGPEGNIWDLSKKLCIVH
jgi:hypothetical protein